MLFFRLILSLFEYIWLLHVLFAHIFFSIENKFFFGCFLILKDLKNR